MIQTAVFAWVQQPGKTLSLWDTLFWGAAVHHAARHFEDVVLLADDKSTALLSGFYELPFTETIPLKPIREELRHIYELPKLMACVEMAHRNTPFLCIDYDAFCRKRLPKHVLEAGTTAEYRYEPRKWQQELNALLPRPRFPQVDKAACTGILGGNNLDLLSKEANLSIECANHPDNRPYMEKQGGYQLATVLGEAVAGGFPDLCPMFAEADQESYYKAGFMHIAGGKKDAGKVAQAAMHVQYDFPKLYIEIRDKFDMLHQCAT